MRINQCALTIGISICTIQKRDGRYPIFLVLNGPIWDRFVYQLNLRERSATHWFARPLLSMQIVRSFVSILMWIGKSISICLRFISLLIFIRMRRPLIFSLEIWQEKFIKIPVGTRLALRAADKSGWICQRDIMVSVCWTTASMVILRLMVWWH